MPLTIFLEQERVASSEDEGGNCDDAVASTTDSNRQKSAILNALKISASR